MIVLRSFARSWCAGVLAICLLVTGLRPAHADLIVSAPVGCPTVGIEDAVTPSGSALRERLRTLGMSEDECTSRMAQLTPEETENLAGNPEQVQVAGITLGVLMIAAAVVIFVLLWLIGTEKIKL